MIYSAFFKLATAENQLVYVAVYEILIQGETIVVFYRAFATKSKFMRSIRELTSRHVIDYLLSSGNI